MAAAEFIGIPVCRFLQMTPYYWSMVWDLYLDSEERSDRRTGLLYNLYYNSHVKEHEQKTLDNQFPSRHVARVSASSGKALIDPQAQIDMVRQFTAAYEALSG